METAELTAADKEITAIAMDILALAKGQHVEGHPHIASLLAALMAVNSAVVSALSEREKIAARLTFCAFAAGQFDD
jgi:hypothetical protein